MITIINYGSGNVAAIANAYKRLNIDYVVATKPDELYHGSKLILPGVGAFDKTMELLNSSGLTDELNQLVLTKKIPILGVCVGMHVMANKSEEGNLKGLGWFDASVKKLDVSVLNQKPYLPHMGWNSVKSHLNHDLFNDVDLNRGYYFLHSFYFSCNNLKNILASTFYGFDFPSVVNVGNIYGVQFHPEKSHSNGLNLFANFANF